MENRKKIIIYASIVFVSLLILIVGSSYAYFSITSTNSFGSKTISASAPNIGSVILVGDNNTVSLNLSAADMMKKTYNVYYYGTTSGTASTNRTSVQIAHTEVNGEGYFNCSYTLQATNSGTNNLYTAFQGWSGKSTGQIVLTVGGNTYDFNSANLFPKTIQGTTYGATSSSSKIIEASLKFLNNNVDQSVLKNKDITITLTATSFSCSIADGPYYYVFDSTRPSYNFMSVPLESNSGLDYYMIGDNNGDYSMVCGVFSGTEYCVQPNSWSNVSTIKSEMEALGATCDSYMLEGGVLACYNDSVFCNVSFDGFVVCGSMSAGDYCRIESSRGVAGCAD